MKMVPMTAAEFEDFQERSLKDYSIEMSKQMDVSVEETRAQSESQFRKMLPEGLKTKDHFFYTLKSSLGEKLGAVWVMIRTNYGNKTLFVCDIYVEESARGKGCGKKMMTFLEEKAKEMQIPDISLHVFGHNHPARGLYESLGYETTNLYMRKKV